MQGIVQKLIDAVDTDNDSDEPPEPSTDMLSIPIRDLFIFTQSYWVEAYDKLAMWGLQDELELYELLDLDADGDTVENEADDTLNEWFFFLRFACIYVPTLLPITYVVITWLVTSIIEKMCLQFFIAGHTKKIHCFT